MAKIWWGGGDVKNSDILANLSQDPRVKDSAEVSATTMEQYENKKQMSIRKFIETEDKKQEDSYKKEDKEKEGKRRKRTQKEEEGRNTGKKISPTLLPSSVPDSNQTKKNKKKKTLEGGLECVYKKKKCLTHKISLETGKVKKQRRIINKEGKLEVSDMYVSLLVCPAKSRDKSKASSNALQMGESNENLSDEISSRKSPNLPTGADRLEGKVIQGD